MQVCFCLIHQGRRETGEADRAPELAKTRWGNGPAAAQALQARFVRGLLAQRRSSLKLMVSFNRSRGLPAPSIIEGRP